MHRSFAPDPRESRTLRLVPVAQDDNFGGGVCPHDLRELLNSSLMTTLPGEDAGAPFLMRYF
jgi:hypothetical protein